MNHQYDTVLLDLDGTLLSTKPGIQASFEYALMRLREEGRSVIIPDGFNVDSVIGPPLVQSFARLLENEEDVARAAEYYRLRYLEKGWLECVPYDGIPEMISALAQSKKRLLVATSKPEEVSIRILEHFDLAKWFDVIAGASEDGSRVDKQDVIERALALSGAQRAHCVMIGDRSHDMHGAKATGMDAIGVLWGYGSYDELAEYAPVYLAKAAADLCGYLL
ncbi:MAG: HAD-IA family hydrolase [Acetanaerobacterium sp.]